MRAGSALAAALVLAGCGSPEPVITNPFPNPLVLTVPLSCSPGFTLRLVPGPEVGVSQGADKSTATLRVFGVDFPAEASIAYGDSPAEAVQKDAWTSGELGNKSGLNFIVSSDLGKAEEGFPMTLAIYQRLRDPDPDNNRAYLGYQFTGGIPDDAQPRKWSAELRAIGQSATYTGIERPRKRGCDFG